MNSPRNKNFFIKAIFMALILGLVIWLSFEYRESSLTAEHQRTMSDQQMAWAQADAQQAIDAKQAADERAMERSEKLVAALDGPVEAAFKNPELNIGQMLNVVGLACAPADSQVSVTVDRFTEFVVSVTLRDRLSSAQLAELSQCLLQKSVPYVHSVRFIQNNLVLAELDWPAIESVTNWSLVSLAEVERLLSPAKILEQSSPPNTAASKGGTSNPTSEDLSPDQKKIEAADDSFKKIYENHVKALNELVASLDQASQLDSLLSRERLQSRISWLDQMVPQLFAERQFFLNQPAEMERLLEAQGLDPLVISIITRNMKTRNQSGSAIFADVFDAVAAYREQIKVFLNQMGNLWEEWRADPSSKQIMFTSNEAKKAYLSGWNQVIQSAQSVQKTFRLWADYKPAK